MLLAAVESNDGYSASFTAPLSVEGALPPCHPIYVVGGRRVERRLFARFYCSFIR
jgi:hypothetical protein